MSVLDTLALLSAFPLLFFVSPRIPRERESCTLVVVVVIHRWVKAVGGCTPC